MMKQKLFKISFFVVLNACLCSEQNGWSWNQETTQNNSTDIKESESESQIIEEILDSSRNGRALEQYDQVYSDPTIQDALQKGDDSEARNLIKDRLCSLGLMQCDENIEEKRPFIAPEELIYAQPVSINPIGRPIPTIPLNNKHYGPPKPLQYPPNKYHGPQVSKYGPQLSKYGPQGSKFGPQGPQVYGNGPNKPPRRDFGLNTFGSKPFLSNGEILAEGEFLDKPPSLDLLNQPYKFENPNKNVKITVNAQGGSAVTSSNGLVEHVHHHYHHNADGSVNNNKQPSVVINPIPIAAASVSSTLENTNQFLPSQNYIGSTFNGISSSNYGGQSLASYPTSGLSSFTSNSKPVYEQFGPQTFGSTVGQYGTSNLYKKEFNINSGNNNYLQGNYADKYHGSESARAENYDCVCVPYDQCPSSDIIGRKDDLYLAIDPRNLKSDIQAVSEDEERVITDGNGTMTVIKVPIGVKNGAEEVNKKISKREAPLENNFNSTDIEGRQAYYGRPQTSSCGPRHVCCKRPLRPLVPQINNKQCGTRHSQGINGRIKNPVYVDGDSEFGEYPWQVAILKKDPKESVYVCGGTLVDPLHILTAAHCVKQYTNYDLRVRLGEWDVNHDVEFYPYIERDVTTLTVHPEFYAGTLYNDLAILRLDTPVDFTKNPHISPACLPYLNDDYSGTRCWTTGWGKDAFGDFGKYQNILKEVDVPVISNQVCQRQLQNTRLGYEFKLHPGFVCAGGEEGKDACKGDGGGPMVCERGGTWQLVGIVSWGIGCGQVGVPGVYVKVAHYLDWIRQVTQRY